MAPEYGATMGFFPVDAETLNYLRLSGRSEEHVALVEAYTKAQGLFRTDDTPDPVFTDTLELDLGTVEPSLAGPRRPQDRVPLSKAAAMYQEALAADLAKLVHPRRRGRSAAKADGGRARRRSCRRRVIRQDDEGGAQQQHEHDRASRASTTAQTSR